MSPWPRMWRRCSSWKGPHQRRFFGPTMATRCGRAPTSSATRRHRTWAAILMSFSGISIAFNQGSFQAQEPGRGLVVHTVGPAQEGSLDRTLAGAGMGMFLIDLTATPGDGPVARWLAAKPPTRWIGAVYSEARAQEHLHAADPRRESDILDFLECTTAARPTRSGRRPLWSSPELAASPTNLQLSGAGELPDFWTSSSSWRMHGHEVALSNARSPGGGRTLRISRTAAPWRWGEGWLTQAFAAEPWRGKRLRLSGAVRTEVHAAGAGGQLYVEVRPEPPAGAIWRLPATHVAMIARPVRSDQWETYQVEVDGRERPIPSASAARWLGMGRRGLAISRWPRAKPWLATLHTVASHVATRRYRRYS